MNKTTQTMRYRQSLIQYTEKHGVTNKYTIRLGFVIVDDAKRGYGYGKGTIRLALKYSFEILHAKKVTISVFENNMPAYRCYKAAGFKDVPVGKPETCFLFGENWNMIELEMSKSDHKRLSLQDIKR